MVTSLLSDLAAPVMRGGAMGAEGKAVLKHRVWLVSRMQGIQYPDSATRTLEHQ